MKRKFTLIEVVVAIGILMAVMGIAAFAFASVQSTWRTTSELEFRLKQCQMIDRVLDQAIRNAVPFYWKDRNNKEIVLFQGGDRTLFLTYLHRIDNRDLGGIRCLRLYVDRDRLMAEYRQTPILPETDPESSNLQHETIAEGIKNIRFQYADLQQEELKWYETWDPEEMKNIPLAILMTVEFVDGQSEVWLRRTAGAGRSRQYGNRQAAIR